MLIFIEFLHLCMKNSMSEIPNRHETKPSMYVLVDPGNPHGSRNPPWIRETPQMVQEPPMAHAYLCIWLMLMYLAHAIVFGSC